jgi:hypothetical protein
MISVTYPADGRWYMVFAAAMVKKLKAFDSRHASVEYSSVA